MKKLSILFLLSVSLLLLSNCKRAQPILVKLGGNTMGTTYSVVYVGNEEVSASLEGIDLQKEIDNRLQAINQLMSTYIEDSELSLLNKAPAYEPITISDETLYVLEKAVELGKLSQGKLDITVGPLVNLWGFGPNFKPEKAPSKEDLAQVKDYVGLDKFTLQGNDLTKLHDKVYIDLSTIAKGYGVDEISELLISYGIDNFLVEIGGEMRVAGTKPGNNAWRVAVEKPISGERAIQRVLNLTDSAVATSGDYRNYFEENGRRYSHLIDPNTAEPIQHNLVSVTVVSDKSIIADGLATALIVMGAEDGMELAKNENIAALFISKDGDEFVESASPAFIEKLGNDY